MPLALRLYPLRLLFSGGKASCFVSSLIQDSIEELGPCQGLKERQKDKSVLLKILTKRGKKVLFFSPIFFFPTSCFCPNFLNIQCPISELPALGQGVIIMLIFYFCPPQKECWSLRERQFPFLEAYFIWKCENKKLGILFRGLSCGDDGAETADRWGGGCFGPDWLWLPRPNSEQGRVIPCPSSPQVILLGLHHSLKLLHQRLYRARAS